MAKKNLPYPAEKIGELLIEVDNEVAKKSDLNDFVKKESGRGLSTNDYSTAEKNKLAGIQEGAQKNTVTSVRGALQLNPQVGNVVISAADIGLGNANTRLTSLENNKLDKSEKGATNGVASLDENGRVPSSQLPSYVDDVIDEYAFAQFPATGETGKIYIAKDTNKTYRWSGNGYAEISASLALGETEQTAYSGAKGKKNAEDIAKLAKDLDGTHLLASNAESAISEVVELTIPAIESELENTLGKTEKAADSAKLGGQLPDYYSPKEGSWYFNENITAEVGWCTVAKYPATTPLQPRGKFKFLLVTAGGSCTPLVEEYEGDISWNAENCYFARNIGYSQYTNGIRLVNDGSHTHLQVYFRRAFSGIVYVPYNRFVACTTNQSWQWQSGALVKSDVESGVVEADFGFSNGFSHSRSIQALGGFIGNLEGTADESDTIRVVGTVETNGWFPMLMTNNGSIGAIRYDTLFIGKENNVLCNPSTGAVSAPKFIGALQGNADSATTASRLGGSMYEYRSFTKNDNSGWPMLLLLSECSDLYNGNALSTKQYGFTGIANSSRSEGSVTQDNVVLLTARHGYSSTSTSGRALYTSHSYLAPKVVKYNDKYYVALIVTGSYRTIALVGKFYNALEEFIKLNYTSASALPSGVEIIQYGSDYYRLNVLSATKLDTPRTIWGQNFDGSGDVRGDIQLLNKDSTDGNASSALIEFSGGYRYYGPYIKAESSPTYGGYGRKDLKVYQRKATVWPSDYSNHFVAMIINAIGNVGIGTTSPSEKLDVAGNIKASGLIIGEPDAVLADYDGAVKVMGEAYIKGSIHAESSYHDMNYTTSDERLKDFEGDVEVDLEKIKTLPKKYFRWKEHPERGRTLGTSAQALQEIYPELVATRTDGMLSVNYEGLAIVALAAVDKLAEKNAELERRLARIEKLLNIE